MKIGLITDASEIEEHGDCELLLLSNIDSNSTTVVYCSEALRLAWEEDDSFQEKLSSGKVLEGTFPIPSLKPRPDIS